MKSFFIALAAFGICAASYAQDEGNNPEKKEKDPNFSLELNLNNEKKPKKTNPKIVTEIGYFDMGINFLRSDGGFSLSDELEVLDLNHPKSTNLNFHLLDQRISLVKRKLNFQWGLSFNVYNYNFESDRVLLPKMDEVSFSIDSLVPKLKRNVLRTSYFTLPLALNLETKPDHYSKSIHIVAGGYVGIRMKTSQRIKTDLNYKQRIINADRLNTNPLRYGVFGQIGFGNVSLFADIAMSGLFKDDESGMYKVKPFSVGICINH